MELEGHHDGREDAKTARDRALGAIVGADFETARSLWRAAGRYNERMKLAGTDGDCADPRLLRAMGAERIGSHEAQ